MQTTLLNGYEVLKMDLVGRKKLRDITAKLRQALEKDFAEQATLDDRVGEKAWRWAIRLAVEQAMQVRGIEGDTPSFLTAATQAGDRPSEEALCHCRGLLAGAGDDTGPFVAADALGWLHQYWHDSERQAISANSGGEQYNKITAQEIIPATQVYTDRYIVEFLVQNSLGAYWLQMQPGSCLAADWRFYVQRPAGPLLPAKRAAAITVIDPACGCGNFLLAAFDLLYAMYREEDQAASAEAICLSILNHNLFGIDIDAGAVDITRAALWLKAREKAPDLDDSLLNGFFSHLVAAAPTGELGSLLQGGEAAGQGHLAALLGCRYDVVVTNPPYVDKRDYSRSVRAYLRQHYPTGAGNLYAAFILRCLALADGYVGMITPQTFLFLTSYTALRREIFGQASVRTLAHLGLGTFEDAVVDTAMFVLAKRKPGQEELPGIYIKLLEEPQKEAALLASVVAAGCNPLPNHIYYRTLGQVTALDGAPLTYWLGDGMLEIVQKSRTLKDFADVVLGMKTSDNRRFLRLWWELGPAGEASGPQGWAPYEKEASGYRFCRNSAHWVRWTEAAREYYQTHYSAQLPNPKYWFQPGLVYGLVSSKAFTAKLLPAGHMADMAASCIYPCDTADSCFLLGLLNSTLYQWLLKMFNPTVNFQPVDVQRLPVPEMAREYREKVADLAARAAETIGRLRQREIPDRCYRFSPETFLPLGDKLPQTAKEIWLEALEYILAKSSIDLTLAEALKLPQAEYRAIIAEMGGLSAEYPAVAGYDVLPVGLSDGLFIPPGQVVPVDESKLEAVKYRLKQLYQQDWTNYWTVTAADFLEDAAAKLALHPITVYHLIREGIDRESWGGGSLERRLAEDAFSAMVLWLMGHRWPQQVQGADAETFSPGVVPSRPGQAGGSLGQRVRGFTGGYCDQDEAERQFCEITGFELERWLEDVFFKRHVSQFKKRPVVWQLASRSGGGAAFSCFLHHRQAGEIRQLVSRIVVSLLDQTSADRNNGSRAELEDFAARLAGLERYAPRLDLGIRANLAPLQQAGLLKYAVLSPPDVAVAAADHIRWQEYFF